MWLPFFAQLSCFVRSSVGCLQPTNYVMTFFTSVGWNISTILQLTPIFHKLLQRFPKIALPTVVHAVYYPYNFHQPPNTMYKFIIFLASIEELWSNLTQKVNPDLQPSPARK